MSSSGTSAVFRRGAVKLPPRSAAARVELSSVLPGKRATMLEDCTDILRPRAEYDLLKAVSLTQAAFDPLLRRRGYDYGALLEVL